MKQFRLLATTLAASMVFFLSSCGSGNEKKTEEKASDSSTVKPAETAPETAPDKLTNLVIIKHKVANFSKWKMDYDEHDPARRAAGLTNYILGRGAGKDSNMVVVMLKAADMTRAKEFASSTELKDAMQKAGASGSPSISYINVVMNDPSQIPQTDRLMVTHKVKDWDAWKKEFDDHKQARIDAGLIDRGLGYTSGDSHNVSIVFAITDMAKAKAFIVSKDLKDKMAQAGVEGPPTFFFYNVVQKY